MQAQTPSNDEQVVAQQQPIKCKKLLLKPSIPDYLLAIVKDTNLEAITSNNWEKYSMPQICPYIIQWQHDGICQFYANRYSAMYIQMQDISFTKLKYMNTWGNNIDSIECISRIYWPNLQQICLWDNKIVSLRPFRRVFAPNLVWLDLKTNLILDHDSLSEFYCPSKRYTRLHVTLVGSSSSLVKVQPDTFSDMQIRCFLSVENQKDRKDKINRKFCKT